MSGLQKNGDEAAVKTGKAKGKKIKNNSSVINNVDLMVEVFLGNAKLSIAELKKLDVDSVLELDASLNQSVELRLNGVAIAQGELVAVGDKFGVRISNLAQ